MHFKCSSLHSLDIEMSSIEKQMTDSAKTELMKKEEGMILSSESQ